MAGTPALLMGDQTKRMNVLYRTEKESGVLKDSEKWRMVFPYGLYFF